MQNTELSLQVSLQFHMEETTNDLSMNTGEELKNRKVNFHSQVFFFFL